MLLRTVGCLPGSVVNIFNVKPGADVGHTDDNIMYRTGVFLSLLPPLRADRRLAMLFVVVSTAIFLVSAPFAKVPLAAIPGFIPVCQSALFMSDLLTAVLLYGQYSI